MKNILKHALVLLLCMIIVCIGFEAPVYAAKGNIRAMVITGDYFADDSHELMDGFLNGNNMGGYKLTSVKHYYYYKNRNWTEKIFNKYIDKAFKGASNNDISFFYYCGHGAYNKGTKKGVGLLLTDSTYFPYDNLAKKLSKIKGTKVVILDACYAGEFINSVRRLSSSDRKEFQVITASGDKKTGLKFFKSGLDIIRFNKDYPRCTYMIAKGVGVKGGSSLKADKDNNRKVTIKELYNYINNRINTSNPQWYGNKKFVIYERSYSGGGNGSSGNGGGGGFR